MRCDEEPQRGGSSQGCRAARRPLAASRGAKSRRAESRGAKSRGAVSRGAEYGVASRGDK
eukprot:scaffold18151_cov48-Phaeocystis_antarctica.AAC.2